MIRENILCDLPIGIREFITDSDIENALQLTKAWPVFPTSTGFSALTLQPTTFQFLLAVWQFVLAVALRLVSLDAAETMKPTSFFTKKPRP